ncbi:MAG: FkbM family methyltransferase [bacterium]
MKVVFDCGANDGDTSVKFLNHFPKIEKIYAFEPLYKMFAKKPFSTTISNSDKIEMFEYALWDSKKTIQLKNQGFGSHLIFDNNRENNSKNKFKDIETELYHSVQTISIDEFMRENNINKLDFAKFDVEGAELGALIGAKNTLIKDRPQLAVCLYHKNEDFYEIPLYLNSILSNYTFKFSQEFRTSLLYAIPNELYNSN